METAVWNIDRAHSGISFSVRHMVFAKVRGRFRAFSGSVQLDEQDLTRSSARVEIDASSIDTGLAERDAHLRSPDFLDVQRFPKLTFESKRVERVSGERYRIHGDLTMRGVTRAIVLEATYDGQGKDPSGIYRAAFTATTALDRGAFGLKWNQALEAGGVLVGERVDIEIEVQVIRAAASQAA